MSEVRAHYPSHRVFHQIHDHMPRPIIYTKVIPVVKMKQWKPIHHLDMKLYEFAHNRKIFFLGLSSRSGGLGSRSKILGAFSWYLGPGAALQICRKYFVLTSETIPLAHCSGVESVRGTWSGTGWSVVLTSATNTTPASGTWWPVIHGRVFLVPCIKWLFSVCTRVQ